MVGYLTMLYQLQRLFSVELRERMITFCEIEVAGEGSVMSYHPEICLK
jgi:hypothetical protein